ncbi:protein of unknown function [Methylocella tundrae]|uniref:Uncharacterized protein n=1 Tax=Methylocella tundrae TaxID=227605 RepID=A0A4U8Z0X8_METTU|nr:protein of unknown function [Methylocella tundrae]
MPKRLPLRRRPPGECVTKLYLASTGACNKIHLESSPWSRLISTNYQPDMLTSLRQAAVEPKTKNKQTIKGFFEAFAGRRFCQIDLAFCPWAGCGGAPSERRRDRE